MVSILKELPKIAAFLKFFRNIIYTSFRKVIEKILENTPHDRGNA